MTTDSHLELGLIFTTIITDLPRRAKPCGCGRGPWRTAIWQYYGTNEASAVHQILSRHQSLSRYNVSYVELLVACLHTRVAHGVRTVPSLWPRTAYPTCAFAHSIGERRYHAQCEATDTTAPLPPHDAVTRSWHLCAPGNQASVEGISDCVASSLQDQVMCSRGR